MDTFQGNYLNGNLRLRQVERYSGLIDGQSIVITIPFDAASQEIEAVATDLADLLHFSSPKLHLVAIANARPQDHPSDDDELETHHAYFQGCYSRTAFRLLNALDRKSVCANIRPPLNVELDTFSYRVRRIVEPNRLIDNPRNSVHIWTPIVHSPDSSILRISSPWDITVCLADTVGAIKLIEYIPDNPRFGQDGFEYSAIDCEGAKTMLESITTSTSTSTSTSPALQNRVQSLVHSYRANILSMALAFLENSKGTRRRAHLISSLHPRALLMELLSVNGDGLLIKKRTTINSVKQSSKPQR